ncbi:MAG: O-antigen ligase family protein, partial [Mesorhizobium sp.]
MSKVLSQRYRRVLFVVGAGSLVMAVVAALNLGLLDVVLGIFGKDSTLTGRTYLWEQGWEAAQQRPLLGYGYAAYWVQGFADPERLWAEFYISTRTGFHFHNTYVETLVEIGFIGATLLALVILRAFYGHVSKVVFGDWSADSVVLAGAIGLMLIRSFFEVEMLGPYFMASFIVYY